MARAQTASVRLIMRVTGNRLELVQTPRASKQPYRVTSFTLGFIVRVSSHREPDGLLFLALEHCLASELFKLTENYSFFPIALRSTAFQANLELVNDYASQGCHLSSLPIHRR